MSGQEGWLDFASLLEVCAHRLAELVGSDSFSVALRREPGEAPNIVVARGSFFRRSEHVEEAFSFLLRELLRCGRPLYVAADDLPPELMSLKAALDAADSSGMAMFPVHGDGELAGLCLAPTGGVLPFPHDETAWTSFGIAMRTLELAAATVALGTLEELRAHHPAGAEIDGLMTVDASGRIIIARGLCREVLTRSAAPLIGARVQDLFGETPLSTLLDEDGDGMTWTEHVLPPSEGRGIAVGAAVAPRSARVVAQGLGYRVICLRDLRAEPGRRPLQLSFELATEVACALDVLDIGGPSFDQQAAGLPLRDSRAIPADLVRDAAALVEAVLPPDIRAEGVSGGQLNELVRGSLHLSERALASERIRVFSLLQPELPSASVDPVLLFRTLRRLLDAARTSLAGCGGSVTVKTGQMEDQPYVTVSDDGGGRSGYPEERVGVPLFRLDETTSESALGDLRDSLERARAKLWVERRPGLWTRVTLLLPPMSSPAIADENGDTPSGAGDPRVLSVLVVDDNPALRSVLRRYLERRGHDVTEASDGEEGLIAVADRDFDRLIVDVHMPGKGGPEFYEGLGLSAPQLRPRTIFMTGGYMESAVERFILESGRPSLSKPFDLEELARAVET